MQADSHTVLAQKNHHAWPIKHEPSYIHVAPLGELYSWISLGGVFASPWLAWIRYANTSFFYLHTSLTAFLPTQLPNSLPTNPFIYHPTYIPTLPIISTLLALPTCLPHLPGQPYLSYPPYQFYPPTLHV